MTHNTLKNNPKQFSWNKVNLQNQIKRFLVRTPVCQILQTIFIAVLLCNVFNSQEVSHLLKKKKSFSICKAQMTTVMPMSLHYSSLGDCTKMVMKNAKLQQMSIQIKKYFSHHWYSAKLHVQIHSKERIHGSNKSQSQIYCDNA